MKYQKTIEVVRCDFCDSGTDRKCQMCHKDVCYECGTELSREVFGVSGFMYCPDCFPKVLSGAAGGSLEKALLVAKHLKDEHDGWYADFNKRREEAQVKIAELLKDGTTP